MDKLLITSLKSKPSPYIAELAFHPELREWTLEKIQSGIGLREQAITRYKNLARELQAEIASQVEREKRLRREINILNRWLWNHRIESAKKEVQKFRARLDQVNQKKIKVEDQIDQLKTELDFRLLLKKPTEEK